MIAAKSAWVNGSLVPFDTCSLHVSAFGLHYGMGVFEGIRCYRRDSGRSGVFRLQEHIRRLFASAHICGMQIPYSQDEMQQACIEVLRDNELDEAYIRPLVLTDAGALGLGALDNPIRTVVFAWRWQPPLASATALPGVRAQVSSFVRGHANSVMSKAKITGQYVQSVLAKREALRLGFDEAVLLDTNGLVAEGSAQNIFAVWSDELVTPPTSGPLLPGITRDAVIALAQRKGIRVSERNFTRDSLYTADEVFFTGTAIELAPVREIDGRPVGGGAPGPVTQQLLEEFQAAIRGPGLPWPHWITLV